MAKIYLSDIFTQLGSSEYSQQFHMDAGSIRVSEYPEIIAKLNLALIDVYTRIPLKLGQVDVMLNPAVSTYVLDSQYNRNIVTNSVFERYIVDSPSQPFTDDVIVITRVFNELGESLYMNDENQQWSIQVHDYNVIYHPYPDIENMLMVEYQALHAPVPLVTTAAEAANTYIDVPSNILTALLHFIAGRSHIGLQADNPNNQNYSAQHQYEQSLLRIEKLNIQHSPQWTNVKLDEKGFI